MASAKVTSKGQITIPKVIRDALGLETGDQVEFLVHDQGLVEIRPRTRSLQSLAGTLRTSVRGAAVADMDAGIGRAVSREHKRSSR
jgi:AbrB family looped-hinge helix DNA binding protein